MKVLAYVGCYTDEKQEGIRLFEADSFISPGHKTRLPGRPLVCSASMRIRSRPCRAFVDRPVNQ